MGVVHHAVFPVWFEMGRTELLRDSGHTYRDLEATGAFLVVIDLAVRYRRPAFYDDDLIVHTTLTEAGRVKVRHQYEVRRGREVLVTASTVLACVSRDGRARAMPEEVVGGSDGAT